MASCPSLCQAEAGTGAEAGSHQARCQEDEVAALLSPCALPLHPAQFCIPLLQSPCTCLSVSVQSRSGQPGCKKAALDSQARVLHCSTSASGLAVPRFLGTLLGPRTGCCVLCHLNMCPSADQGLSSALSEVLEVVCSSVLAVAFTCARSCSGEAGAELLVQACVCIRLPALTFS